MIYIQFLMLRSQGEMVPMREPKPRISMLVQLRFVPIKGPGLHGDPMELQYVGHLPALDCAAGPSRAASVSLGTHVGLSCFSLSV